MIETVFNCVDCDTRQVIELEMGETDVECCNPKCRGVNIIRLREAGSDV